MGKKPRRNGRFFFLLLGTLTVLLTLGVSALGCTTLRYLIQAGGGQLALLNGARSMGDVIQDERTPPRLRELLQEIPNIKKFGESHGLKATSNYREYVKLNRDAVVWVVSASEPYEFKSRTWTFPLVGSFTYMGWFDVENANSFADELRQEAGHLDVDVRGARAYSTLGWFRDPVLSTMIPRGDHAYGDLVNLVLHESVHATLYVNDQSIFNESVASFLADRLTPIYIAEKKGKDSVEMKSYREGDERSKRWTKKFHETYVELEKLYSSALPQKDMDIKKRAILDKLENEFKIKKKINNATLVQYKTYGTGENHFSTLLNACGGNWNRFLKTLGAMAPEKFGKPQTEDLSVLSALACVSL